MAPRLRDAARACRNVDLLQPRPAAGALEFGGVGLRRLSPMHVQAMLRQMEEADASRRGRQMTYTVLRTAIRDAVRMRLLVVNPLDAVSRPRAPRPEIKALDAEQTRALVAAAQGDPFEALYVLAVATGLRLGELVGLHWGDIDLAAGALHVRRSAVVGAKGAVTFAEPKT